MTTPRDNLLSLLRRTGYARAPVELDLCPSLKDGFKRRMAEAGTPDRTLADYFGDELFPVAYLPGPAAAPRAPVDWNRYYAHDPLKPGATVDRLWGVAHEPGSAAAVHMTHMRHPMETFDSVEQFAAYPWPDFSGAGADAGALADAVRDARARGKAAWSWQACTVWETAWYLRGMENLMMDMMEDSPLAVCLLDAVADRAADRARRAARAGTDILHLGDDIGMQSRPMMSLDLYRAWLKPRLARVIAAARAEKPDIVIDYHSCGYVLPFVDDLAEIGVDVLNPVQPECMDFAEVRARFGDRLSFRGTLGTQTTMPFGTPAEVRDAVRRNLDLAGPRGGLWCVPTHMLEPEVPWANIEAYVDSCREYRPGHG